MAQMLWFDVSDYDSGLRHLPHRHPEMQLSLILRGRVRETVGRRTEVGSSLSVVVKDSGVFHADEFGPEAPKIARLTLPSGTLADLLDDKSRAVSWKWTHDPRVARPFLKLIRAIRERSVEAGDPLLLDLLAAFTARQVATRGKSPEWLDETIEEIRCAWTPGLTVRDVAKRAGVHPVYLARCVRRWYGTGVAEELRRARVRAAARALGQMDRTVSTIAHRHGYSDEAHLCRDLKRSLGFTPRRLRNLVAQLS